MIATFYWNEEKFGNNDISEIIAPRINFWPLSGDEWWYTLKMYRKDRPTSQLRQLIDEQ